MTKYKTKIKKEIYETNISLGVLTKNLNEQIIDVRSVIDATYKNIKIQSENYEFTKISAAGFVSAGSKYTESVGKSPTTPVRQFSAAAHC